MSSERESANLAFYAIVYSKGLVEKQQLQGALNKATLDGLPLETVLLEAGAIKPAACVEVLSERAELGRTCRECEGVTYVLPDEDPSTKKCESCGGRLKRSKREEREARRTERHERQKRGGVSGTHKRRPVATASPGTGSPSRDLKALTDRLNELEAKVAEQVHQAVDTRLAQEDLQGYLDRMIPEQIERTLAEADLSGIVDRVSDEALQTVSARVEEADLSGLYDRVADEALEKVSGRLPAGGGASAPEVDTKAIVEDATDQAAEQVLRSVRAEMEALEEQVVAKATQRAMAMVQELKESSEEQASLAENGRLAVEEMLSQYDLPTLSDRITEQVLQALDARDDTDEEEGEEGGSNGAAASPEVLARIDAIDASMQELLDEMVDLSVPTMKQELEALTQLDLAGLRQQSADDLAALGARVDGFASLQEAADELRRKVDELIANPPKLDFDPSSLRAELREEAVEVATRKAISAAKEEIQAAGVKGETDSLEGLSGATDQVTAQVMQRLEETLETQSKQLADQAMAIIQKSLGSMDMSALTNKVMNEAYAGVEERLGELSPAGGGGGGEVDMEALKAAVTEAVLPGLEANLAERLDRDLADLPDRIGQQAAGPVLAAIESRIEKLDLRNLPAKIAAEAMPVIAEQVTARVLEQVGAAGGGENGGASSEELQKTKAGILEWVESRFAQIPPAEAIVQMATSKATDALEARLGEIEVKLAELEAAALTGGGDGGGGGGASAEEVAQVVQAQVLAEVEERLAAFQPSNGGGGASPEEVAQVVQAQVMAEVEERLAAFQPSGGGAEADEVAQFVMAKVEERLASLPTGGGDDGDGAGMAELAAQNALAAVEARLSELGGSGGLSEERVEEIARKAALEVGQAQGASGELAEMAVPSGSSVIKLPGFEKKFISLAKEVKNLRQTLSRMQAVASESVVSSSPTGGGGGGDLVAALNSPEFKQMFDNKINQVMGYMKSDVIPKTVKKVLAEQ